MSGKHSLFAGVSLGIIIWGVLASFWGCETTWRWFNVPALSPNFADMRVITSGAESRALGFDPMVSNPRDPWHRQLNYPRIWQLLYRAGINQQYTAAFGVALAVLFVVGLFLQMPSTINHWTAAVLMLSLFSPAVLLGVERGNIDLLMFFLLAAAIYGIKKNVAATTALAVALVLMAFILKLYPLFGIGLLLGQKRKVALQAGLLAALAAMLYVGASYRDLVMIRQVTPQFQYGSYGLDMLWLNVGGDFLSGRITAELCYLAVALCLVLALFGICSPKFETTEICDPDQRTMDAFRVGSGIYLGTFLLWNNVNYRLVFLLFVIPQLMFWSRSPSRRISIVSRSTLLAILVSMWTLALCRLADAMHLGLWGALLLQVSNLLIFAGLLFLFFRSVPRWFKDRVANLDALLGRYC